MILEQIRSVDGTGTLTYLVADEESGDAAIIDPNLDDVARIEKKLFENNLRLVYAIDTHTHADHVSGAGKLQEHTGAHVVMHERTKDKWKVIEQGDKFGIGDILRKNATIRIDRYVNEGDSLQLGDLTLEILHTPGHTDNHLAVKVEDNLFTGDLLLVGQAGRSDLPGGHAAAQYDSLYNKVLKLTDETRIYPGHDYENNVFTLLGIERTSNPFLKQPSREAFISFVKEYFPPIADANGGKVILQCGAQRVQTGTTLYKDIAPQELITMRESDPTLFLLDVREPNELLRIGAIEGVANIPVGQLAGRLNEVPKDRTIVAICQKGGRSAEAAHVLTSNGFSAVYNLTGGTGGWIENGLPVVKEIAPQVV